MTPKQTERVAYARKRIERLNATIVKLEGVNAVLKPNAALTNMNDAIIVNNDMRIASSRNAIKRWEKEIAELTNG